MRAGSRLPRPALINGPAAIYPGTTAASDDAATRIGPMTFYSDRPAEDASDILQGLQRSMCYIGQGNKVITSSLALMTPGSIGNEAMDVLPFSFSMG